MAPKDKSFIDMDIIILLLTFAFGLVCSQSAQNIQINVEAKEEIVAGRHFLASVAERANLTATSDSGEVLNYEYSILAGKYKDYFQIEPNSYLFMVRRVDRETECPTEEVCIISVQIGATAALVFTIIDVEVTIQDTNDNRPTFSSNVKNFQIAEGTSPGTGFELPSARDADAGINSIQDFLLEPEGASFELEKHKNMDGTISLNLILNLSLDREMMDSYKLFVKAVDGGDPSLTGTLTININVTDINDNRPVFKVQEYNTTIDEDIEVGTGIVNVTATDRDIGENGRLTYKFPGKEPDSFGINEDTGEIYLKRAFESETGPFTLFVEAWDNGEPEKKSFQARVIIHVKDINDNAPVIQLSMLIDDNLIFENTKIGTPVAHIRVTDADTGLNGEAVCFCNNSNFTIHEIGINNFRVDVSANFDRELVDKYEVTINCSDKGEPSLSVTEDFEIRIGDINDHVPVFTQATYSANVSENNQIGAVLLRVSAIDLDIGINARINYSIVPFDRAGNFSIDTEKGFITASAVFDREDQDYYVFTVTASNPGMPNVVDNATVKIRILDKNDNAPDFNADSYAMSVNENSPNGTSTGQVYADDADLGDNGRVSYRISSPSVPFIVLDDGTVVTTQVLNREDIANYEFELIAVDHGSPPQQSSIPVYVIVLDVNDNPPYLDFPYGDNDTVAVPHTTIPNSIITKIVANDDDDKKNKLLTYSIISGNEDGIFHIDANTGDIILRKQVFGDDIKMYTLTVLVKDRGDKPLETRATLHIKFYVANDTDQTALTSAGSSQTNMVIVIVISAVTFVLSVIIIATICFIRRKDHQKALYNSKAYDEQRIMPDMHRNSNRSSSSRGSQDKMIATDSQYMENGFQNKKNKKEVSFSLDEEVDGGVSMSPTGNGQFDRVSTFKSPSPVSSEAPPVYQERTSPIPPEDAKQRAIHRMTSLRVHQALMQTNNNNNKLWSQSSQEETGKNYPGLAKNHLDDTHSETSGEATASDSGRGGSDEDIRSTVTNSHDTDDSRSPNTSTSHPFYATENQKPSFSSFHGSNVHRAAPVLSSFGKTRNNPSNEDLYKKNMFPLNDLSSPSRGRDNNNPHRLSSENNYIAPPQDYHVLQFTPGFGLAQRKRDSDPLVDLSMHSDMRNSERDNDEDDNTTTSGSYTINDIQDDILTDVKEDIFYKPDTFV